MSQTVRKPVSRIDSRDWRNCPIERWNTNTFHAYFADMNREMFGVEYAPMRNWSFEQGALRNAIKAHGPELLRQAFDECFRTYRPTREYPILTAGFCVNYRINAIIPRLKAEQAEQAEKERIDRLIPEESPITIEDVAVWL